MAIDVADTEVNVASEQEPSAIDPWKSFQKGEYSPTQEDVKEKGDDVESDLLNWAENRGSRYDPISGNLTSNVHPRGVPYGEEGNATGRRTEGDIELERKRNTD